MTTGVKETAEAKIRMLYKKLLESWNNNNPGDFANLFAENGNTIGFDGSQMNGRRQINDELSQIFASHKVSSYVGIIREFAPFPQLSLFFALSQEWCHRGNQRSTRQLIQFKH